MTDILSSPVTIIILILIALVTIYKILSQGDGFGQMLGKKTAEQEAIDDADQVFINAQQAYIEKRYEASLALFNESASVFRANGARLQNARALLKIAEVSTKINTTIDTVDALEEADFIFKDMQNLAGQAEVTRVYGDYYLYLGQTKEAKEYYDKAIGLCQNAGDNLSLAKIYKNLGDMEVKTKSYTNAREHYDKAIPLLQDAGAMYDLSQALFNLGTLEYRLDNYAKAKNSFKQAAPIYMQLGDKNGLANSHFGEATVEYDSNNYIEAVKAFKEALYVYEDSANEFGMARARLGLGTAYEKLGMFADALKELKIAIPSLEQHNAAQDQAKGLLCIGNIELANNAYESALNSFQSARPLYQLETNEKGEARALLGIGKVRFVQGKNEEAESLTLEVLETLKRYNDKEGLADTYIVLCKINMAKKDLSTAAQYISNAIDDAHGLKNKIYEAEAYYELGKLSVLEGNNLQAKSHYTKALQLAQMASAKNIEAHVLLQSAILEEKDKQYVKASDNFDKARSLYDSNHNLEGQVICNTHLAMLALHQNDIRDATSKIERIIDHIATIYHPETIVQAAVAYAKINMEAGEKEKALQMLRQSESKLASLNNPKHLSLLQLEIAKLQSDDPKETIKNLKNIAQDFKNAQDMQNYVSVLGEIGRQYSLLEAYDDAEKAISSAIRLYEQDKSLQVEAKLYYTLGTIYQKQGNEQEAEAQYRQASQYARQHKDNVTLLDSVLKLAQLYKEKMPSRSYEYYKEAEKILRKMPEHNKKTAVTFWRIGKMEFAMGNYKEAKKYLEEAKDIFMTIKDYLGEGNCAATLGLLSSEQKNNKAAIGHFNTACQIFRANGIVAGEAQSYIDMAKIYKKDKDEDNAKKMIENAIFLYTQIGNMERVNEIKASLL